MDHPRFEQLGVPAAIDAVGAWLRALDLGGLSDAERIDAIAGLEALKNTACAAQARLSVDFDTSQRDAQRNAGLPTARLGQGIAAQIALARRESPHRGQVLLGLAKALVGELPCTLRTLEQGVVSEYRATLITKETACLTVEDRAAVDALVAGDVKRVGGLGNRELVAEVKQHAYRLDPHSIVRRNARAVEERNVTVRPAPDAMTYLTALLPVAEGVACYAALARAADSARASGDQRSRGQVMADTLTTRLTGQESAQAVPVGVHLVMTDRTFLGLDDNPAHIDGHGPIPAGTARALIGASDLVASWVRQLYTDQGGKLVAMESRSRCFPDGLATFIRLRDQTCRTPWCDAPIRHTDHTLSVADGGQTAAGNGQGLCEACNYTKQAPDWTHQPPPDTPDTPDPAQDVPQRTAGNTVQTPTGHTYPVIDPPPWPTTRPPPDTEGDGEPAA